MICIPLISPDPELIIKQSKKADLAEVRIDLCGLSLEEVKMVFSSCNNLVATCRPGQYINTERLELLKTAIDNGAKYIDIEIENDEFFRDELIKKAQLKGCQVIISYHNFNITPNTDELEDIVQTCYRQGADVAKIATMVHKPTDCSAILSLFQPGRRLIAIGMGQLGIITRVASLYLGAEFTFASLSNQETTAPGQITIDQMNKIIELI